MRTFLALPLEKETKREINSYIERFKSEIKGRIKWVEEENLHFTIFFFGEIDNNKAEKIKEVVESNKTKFNKFKVEIKKNFIFPK